MRILLAIVSGLAAASVAGATITKDNVASLALKWEFPAGGVTGGPIAKDGLLYFGSWDGHVYAVDQVTGAEVWAAAVTGPVSGSVFLTDDGGICYGTLTAEVGCLDVTDGSVRWKRTLDDLLPAAIWSAPGGANGRLFVGIASLNDDPMCSRGRILALDQGDGHELWRFYTVPDKVCTTDTAVECTGDGDCPDGGTCVTGRGGGVTATPAVDATGQWVYMNAVGCYTFPSIGESDSAFKLDAETGHVEWRNRVSQPEQFGVCFADTGTTCTTSDDCMGIVGTCEAGACVENTGIDCGTDGDCAVVTGMCRTKSFYHDFGFLNGPNLVEVSGAMRVISGSKNGTLYSFKEFDGMIDWKSVVRTEPITPGFAGFGLFNGAVRYVDGYVYAALNTLVPPRVCSNDPQKGCSSDAACAPGGTCPPEREHLARFDATNGTIDWTAEIGRSWSSVQVENGVVYAGTEDTDGDTNTSWLYAHDATTGERLATFPLPASSEARSAVAGDTLFVGYGIPSGGVRAFSLCGNGTVDPGEDCDPAASATCCTAACKFAASGAGCDDGDACTSSDQCDGAGDCAGDYTTTDEVGCALDRLAASPCNDESLPTGLAKSVTRTIGAVKNLLAKAATLAGKGKTAKVERLRKAAGRKLDALGKKVAKAAASKKAAKQISADCKTALDGLIASEKQIVAAFVF
jgi:outer membrane protein assembly factor BamB